MRRTLTSLICLALSASLAAAADIQVIEVPGTSYGIASVKGSIVEGDAAKFKDIVRGLDKVTVFLESPGGLVREGLDIADEIRRRDFATVVTDDCYSICGIIWLAGARRYMGKDASIGFHAAYSTENGEARESGVANAVIGAYLTKWGFRIEAIEFITKTGPDDILVLTPGTARIIGIELYKVDANDIAMPATAPTADMYAEAYMVYRLLGSICAELFQVDSGAIENAYDAATRSGVALVGEQKWAEILWPYVDVGVSEVEEKGGVQVCLGIQQRLLDRDMATGITGPSFLCSAASTSTELAICSDQSLWAKDRATTAIFHRIRGLNDAHIRKQMLSDQRAWLVERNACGGNLDCLHSAYDDRLEAFRDVDMSSVQAR